jgi:hypothetical protein
MTIAEKVIVALLAGILVVLLLIYARGPEHQRGDDVGALRAAGGALHV